MQTVILVLVLAAAALYVGRLVWRTVRAAVRPADAGCGSGCGCSAPASAPVPPIAKGAQPVEFLDPR